MLPVCFTVSGKTRQLCRKRSLQVESEIFYGIIVADAFYNLPERFLIVGILAVLDPSAQQFAHNPAEIFVPGVGEEASGVRQHSDEVPQAAEVGQAGHLSGHALLVVVEPPRGTLLQLAGGGGVLEAAKDGADGSVIIGV